MMGNRNGANERCDGQYAEDVEQVGSDDGSHRKVKLPLLCRDNGGETLRKTCRYSDNGQSDDGLGQAGPASDIDGPPLGQFGAGEQHDDAENEHSDRGQIGRWKFFMHGIDTAAGVAAGEPMQNEQGQWKACKQHDSIHPVDLVT